MAGSTIVVELSLTRIFDVMLSPSLSYLIVSTAVLGFGLAGLWSALRPTRRPALSQLGLGYGLTVPLLLPLLNALPLNPYWLAERPLSIVLSFGVLVLALLVPFFLAGLFLLLAFASQPARIQSLYSWDLLGAGMAAALMLPLVPWIGPTGLLCWAAAAGLLASLVLARRANRAQRAACSLLGLALLSLPLTRWPGYLEVVHHVNKRGVLRDTAQGRRELIRWDPISLIAVFDKPQGFNKYLAQTKGLQYDGGTQSSFMFPFDGDFARLRQKLERHPDLVREDFWQLGVLASHYLKRDTGHSALIIGSAGGQEVKAALVYGASRVDCLELVSTVVDLVSHRYDAYLGHLFTRPEVHLTAAEGRSALRGSEQRYDVIQIFSNHTSSSIAQGTGALSPVFLQTVEAYQDYFGHLAPEGVLHINHHLYPRLVTTAALAWKGMGRTNFQQHVAVFSTTVQPSLPTVLIKMSPWTQKELDELNAFFRQPPSATGRSRILWTPREAFWPPSSTWETGPLNRSPGECR